MTLETVDLVIKGQVATIKLNRPERRNSFNSQMISDLTSAFCSLKKNMVRCVILSAEGKAFSAGADLDYMRTIKDAGKEENYKEAKALAKLLEIIYTFPSPVIARVNGPAIGGGLGLISACDIALASEDVFFAFSEVRLGLVPAVIGPYVVKAIGERPSRRYMLSGARFDAEEAVRIGLLAKIVSLESLDVEIEKIVKSVLSSSPSALKNCKELIRRCGEEDLDSVKDWTAELIAELRASEEGQEGMNAFFEKRKANWIK